jgi:hypothetical protein
MSNDANHNSARLTAILSDGEGQDWIDDTTFILPPWPTPGRIDYSSGILFSNREKSG